MPLVPRNDPDRDLVLACQSAPAEGFHGAFRTLYDEFKDRVYNVCFRITGNATDALDASQETFGILYRKLADFRFESKFSSWVYRIAVNASIDIKRRAIARPMSSLESLRLDDPEASRVELVDTDTEAPTSAASRHELEADIQSAIDRLSPKMRAITVLRYTEGLTYDEIADVLAISLGTVKSRLSRAHSALDRELTPVLDRHFLGDQRYPGLRPERDLGPGGDVGPHGDADSNDGRNGDSGGTRG
ncbi:MAG: sigma-70 family RNA polymerase sigma factor [Planctomycetota bacterium]